MIHIRRRGETRSVTKMFSMKFERRGSHASVNTRSFVYVDGPQVGPEQAALYREDIGIWLIQKYAQSPVYINEDATGGGLDLMLAMARRAQAVKFAIPSLTHLRGRLSELVIFGDVYVLEPGLLWSHGTSAQCTGHPIAEAPTLRTLRQADSRMIRPIEVAR